MDIKEAVEKLLQGEEVKMVDKSTGKSMVGVLDTGCTITLIPASIEQIFAGDIALVRWHGGFMMHFVKKKWQAQILMENVHGKVNGWVKAKDIIGKVVSVIPPGQE